MGTCPFLIWHCFLLFLFSFQLPSTSYVFYFSHNCTWSFFRFCRSYLSYLFVVSNRSYSLLRPTHFRVVAYPRELPPDEKPFPLKPPGSPSYPNRTCPETPRCSGFPQRIPVTSESKFMSLSDDEDEIGGRSLHICKEEFCMTIGRHVRKPAIKKSISEVEDIYGEEVAAYPSGEEGESCLIWRKYCWTGF